MSAAKCETGWGDSLSIEAVPELRDHPTPLRIPLRFMRNDPPPPGEGADFNHAPVAAPDS